MPDRMCESQPVVCPAAYEIVPAMEESEPPPLLVIKTFCKTGSAPPIVALNVTVCGLTAKIGTGAAVTMNVTGIILSVTPEPLIVTIPGYVPALRRPRTAESVRVAGAIIESREPESQVASSIIESPESVPVPTLVTLTVLGAGSLPPSTAENITEVGNTPITGAGGGGGGGNGDGTTTESAHGLISTIGAKVRCIQSNCALNIAAHCSSSVTLASRGGGIKLVCA